MNIDQIPADTLNRGIILSIVETERPVIESFTDGESIYTMAFLKGTPIPFNVLVLYMSMRFAPQRARGQMEKLYENSVFKFPQEEEVIQLWNRVEVPQDTRKYMESSGTANNAVMGLVNEMFTKLMNSEAEETTASFRSLIHRIEDDYESSLIEPEKI